jgi:hypothetical protein
MSPIDYLFLFVSVVGPLGSIVEHVGTSLFAPRVVRFGQMLESLGVDLPKLFAGRKAPK